MNEFYINWELSINTDKSKLMIFSKTGHSHKEKFRFVICHEVLECVLQYKYLGVNVSNSGKFSVAEKNLSLKANRALFSIKQSIFDKSLKASAILHIFDVLIKPIALYGSEIWNPYKHCYRVNQFMSCLSRL